MGKRARGIIVPAVLLVLAAILGGGCHDPFSNQWFEDDELFLAAIPDAERVTTRVPDNGDAAERKVPWGDPVPAGAAIAEFPVWTWEVSHDLNVFIFMLLYAVEAVTAEPISYREDDRRLWGPVPAENGDDIWFDMTRVEDRFDYEMLWAEPGEGPDGGVVPFSGSFVAGTVPREGQGNFLFRFGVMYELESQPDSLVAGDLYVDHDNRDGQVLLAIDLDGIVGPEGEPPWSAQYAFHLAPEGPGWFEYATEGDLEGTDPAVLEQYEVRTRWLADGSGRADARLSGGDLGAFEYLVTECWDANYMRTYYADNTGFTLPWGDPESCVYLDQELPTHL